MLAGILRRRNGERGRKGGWEKERRRKKVREREREIIKMVTLIIMLSDF